MYSKSELRSPLAKARGLGSAHSGTALWWQQRLLSMALVPLSIWFIASLTQLLAADTPEGVAEWLSSPVSAILLLAFLGMMIFHVKLGLQEVIEDYIHNKALTFVAMILKSGLSWALLLVAAFSIAKLHFIGL
jgi:succinate dehydrogenase / fumarate reductase membrane anchor subunit